MPLNMKNRITSNMRKITKIAMAGSALLLLAAGTLSARELWKEDFSGDSLNGNLITSTQGIGAGVAQVDGQLVLDTALTAGSARAQVSTESDSSGSTTFNGRPLYDFHGHEVTVAFNIASIAGTPNNTQGRNVFYFAIGDDPEAVYVPQEGVLENGLGFSLEQVTDGSTFWRIFYSAITDGVVARGEVVAKISGVPSLLTYTLNGTHATIQIEGATILAIGRAGSGSVGGTQLVVNLEDLSEHISGYTMAFGAYNLGDVAERTIVSLDAISAEVAE
jgi:hypothetical protein